MRNACPRAAASLSFTRRLLPATRCGRAGLALWLAVALLGLLLVWLTSASPPLAGNSGEATPRSAAGARQ